MEQLTLIDYQQMDLGELEAVVDKGLTSFIDTGMALKAIREGKKYKQSGYSTFEIYIKERWGISRPYAYFMIDSGYIADSLSTMVDKDIQMPTAERQVRPLLKLGNANNPTPEKWAEAWKGAVEIADGKTPTAKEVEFVVKEMLWTEPPPIPPGEYRVIYADPPWQFDNSGFDQSAAAHYPTMDTESICNMNIPKASDSVLFLWATNSMIEDALKVVKAWGYNYKTNFVWVKTKGPTIGFYVQSRHELLLIGTRGEGMLPEVKPISVLSGEVTKHSRKPEMYDMIESMYDGPYVELFARNKRDGWESWGNEQV